MNRTRRRKRTVLQPKQIFNRLKVWCLAPGLNKRCLLLFIPLWLCIRLFWTDGFAFHLVGLLLVLHAANFYKREWALIVAMIVTMVDSEGVMYNAAQAPNFFVRTFFFFTVVFVIEFIKQPAKRNTEATAVIRPTVPAGEHLALLDNSKWDHRFTLEEASSSLVKLCRQITSFHTLLYFSYDQEQKSLRAEVQVSHSADLITPLVIPLGVGLVGRLAYQRDRKYISNFTQDWRVLHYYRKPEKIGSVLVIPVEHRNQLSGVLVLDSKSPAHFSPTQVETLQQLADSFDQLWHLSATEVDYQERLTKYRLLLEIQHALTEASGDIERAEKILVDYIDQLVAGDTCTIYYPDAPESSVLLNDRIRCIRNCVSWTAKRCQSLRIGNIKSELHLLQGIKRERFRSGFQSLLVVPVISSGKAVAVIVIEGRQPNQFRAVEEEALKILAAQIGAAFSIARTRDEAQLEHARTLTLLEAQADLCRSLDYQGAQEGILSAFARLLPNNYLLFYRFKGRQAVPSCAIGWEDGLPRRLLRCRAVQRAALSRRVTEIEDILTASESVERRPGVRSLLLIPLVAGMRTTGLIEIGSSQIAGFSATDEALLERLRLTAARWWEAVRHFQKNRDELVTDEVTGLGNYRMQKKLISSANSSLHNQEWQSLSLLVISITELREQAVNSGEWERATARVAEVLGGLLPDSGKLVRRRDDEFLLFFPNTKLADARTLGEKITSRFAGFELYQQSVGQVRLTVRIGIGFGAAGKTADRILLRAEEALAKAKRAGGTKICEYVA